MYSELTRDTNQLTLTHLGHISGPPGSVMPSMVPQTMPMSRADVGPLPLGSASLPMAMGMRLSPQGPLSPPPHNQDITNIDASSTHSSGSSSSSSSSSSSAVINKQRKGKAGVPYIPSYMDLTNGPEPCVVCGDAATGYHYRCMTCEGCKGFFRRTIQKNLQYHCKWNKNCIIDKTTRNQCQECRFTKCLNIGMATDLVLNEKQRKAKRKLIEDNRERRKEEEIRHKIKDSGYDQDALTDHDRGLICEVVTAYEYTAGKATAKSEFSEGVSTDLRSADPESWQQLAEAMTPSIVKVVEFAKGVPGFTQLNVDDQILLLKSCCMEIMCLRAACRFDPEAETLTLHNGMKLHKSQIQQGGLAVLIEPIFDFAVGLAKLHLDKAEIALLAAVLLMQSDRSGLKEPEHVEKLQDAILGAFKRYIAENRPYQPVRWAKILMKVTDLRTISTRHAERVLCIRLDNSGEIPPLLLEVFNEGHNL